MNSKEDKNSTDNGIEEFMTSFKKMFTESKYNLQALNKKVENIDKCFNNIILLNSNKEFNEENEEEKKNELKSEEEEEENNNFQITQKDLDEIEKMFFGLEENSKTKNKNKNKKKNKTNPDSGYYISKKREKSTSDRVLRSNGSNKDKDCSLNSNKKEKNIIGFDDLFNEDIYIDCTETNEKEEKNMKSAQK